MKILHFFIMVVLIQYMNMASLEKNNDDNDNDQDDYIYKDLQSKNSTRFTDAAYIFVHVSTNNLNAYQKLSSFYVDLSKLSCFNKNLPIFWYQLDIMGKMHCVNEWLSADGRLEKSNDLNDHCSDHKKYDSN
jgi:hypothetical protein